MLFGKYYRVEPGTGDYPILKKEPMKNFGIMFD